MNHTVDLALVLAVDCSSSVDGADFRMQMDGIAAALRNPPLLAAIASGPERKIALALVQWSNRKSQFVAVPWRVLGSQRELETLAREIEKSERYWIPGGTGLDAAIDFSAALFDKLQMTSTRRVIDVSGDGQDNENGNPIRARNAAVARGITINGLPIINGSHLIEAYYRDNVIGGKDAFVIPATDMRTFRDTMTQKIMREVESRVV
jgi:Protein of unknown function (DUF1194)